MKGTHSSTAVEFGKVKTLWTLPDEKDPDNLVFVWSEFSKDGVVVTVDDGCELKATRFISWPDFLELALEDYHRDQWARERGFDDNQ